MGDLVEGADDAAWDLIGAYDDAGQDMENLQPFTPEWKAATQRRASALAEPAEPSLRGRTGVGDKVPGTSKTNSPETTGER